MGDEAHLTNILQVQEAFKDKPEVVAATTYTLEKICRSRGAGAAFVKVGGIEATLDRFTMDGSTEESVLSQGPVAVVRRRCRRR